MARNRHTAEQIVNNLWEAEVGLSQGQTVAKAEEAGGASLLDRHFICQQVAQAYYRHRTDDPEALDRAIDSCEKQTRLGTDAAQAWWAEYPDDEALPSHH